MQPSFYTPWLMEHYHELDISMQRELTESIAKGGVLQNKFCKKIALAQCHSPTWTQKYEIKISVQKVNFLKMWTRYGSTYL
jgi:hypothetical protein